MSEYQLVACHQYAKSFNQCDASQFVNLLADEVAYTSHWVFETMNGRDRVAAYLVSTEKNIQRSSLNHEFCILLLLLSNNASVRT
jgi:hypothetical protein